MKMPDTFVMHGVRFKVVSYGPGLNAATYEAECPAGNQHQRYGFYFPKESNMLTSTDSTHAGPRSAAVGNLDDHHYSLYLTRVQLRVNAAAKAGHLFETDAGPKLWDAYLSAFHPSERQYHNCHTCRQFVERFGGLVTIDERGVTRPAVFDAADCDPEDSAAVWAMQRIIQNAKVTGPFLSSAKTWGTEVTGVWRHLHVTPPAALIRRRDRAKTDFQATAEKREDFKNVRRALAEFPPRAVDQALGLLKSDALFRSEKVLGQAQWLHDINEALSAAPRHLHDNVLWRFVAAAPSGFCHPRGSMIGTLLEDIIAGVPFEEAARRFRVKMDPLHYQRPQAAPTAGNVARAEKLFAELGLAPALERRFARVDEVQALWRRAQPKPQPTAGVFGHLLAGKRSPGLATITPPSQPMTFEKFRRLVLPEAREISILVPFSGPFFAMLTAVHADAPPILQWDSEERRNPFSTYTYARTPTPASQWGLAVGWAPLSAIALDPAHWHGEQAHHAKRAFGLIVGAKDSQTGQGNAIFPETLRSELREVRSVIEAYSKLAVIQGREEASACGLPIVGSRLRVLDSLGNTTEYHVDRWD